MLGVAALRLWQRRRGAPAGWLAATFGVLAFVVIVGRVLPQPQHSAILRWFQKIDVIVLLLFPYFLFRFAAAFEEMSVVVRRVAAGLTAAVAVWTLLLPRIPAPDEPRPGWYQAYIVGLLVAWTILSVIAAARLWRAGRGQPAMAGRRMRLLSVGSILMNVALLIAGAAPSTTNYGVQLVTQVLALASAQPMRLRDLRAATGVTDAASILQRNVYGWFARFGRGSYALSAAGHQALSQFADTVAVLALPAAEQVSA